MMSRTSVLEREMYTEAEAARLLRVPQSTLHYWLEGGQRRGKTHRPVIRIEPSGSRAVTWAEFVEAGLLHSYRNARVPMTELRTFIDLLRADLGVAYPLAHHRPFVSGRNLVMQAQDQAGLDPDFCLVAVASGQLILTGPSQLFVDRVTREGDIATAWRPHDDPNSPVRMTPDIRFGKPAIGDVRYYIDADILGLGKLLVQIRNDVTYPGDPGGVLHKRGRQPCPIASPPVPDTERIPVATAHHWLIITRDANIAVNRAEIAAVRDNAARMVTLSGRDAISTWNQLEILMTQWRQIQSLLDQPGPFIYAATRTSIREFDPA